jgi:hypothetical protein
MFRLCDRHIVIIEGLVEAFDMRQTMLLATVLVLCTACTEDPPQIEPTFESISSNVFETSCVDSGCHSASSAAGNLVLEGEGVYDALLNEPCDNPLAIVEGLHRVTPGDETTSLLYLKITDPIGLGMPMPPTTPLNDETIEAIATWIRNSAPE